MLATLIKQSAKRFRSASPLLQVRSLATEAAIPIQLVKELRARTKAGVLECKNALVATNGDLDRAVEWLAQQAKKTADKKSSRITAEGGVFVALQRGVERGSSDVGALLELNSETDFVAKTPDFLKTGQHLVAALVTEHSAERGEGQLDTNALLDTQLSGVTGRGWLEGLVGVTKENCQLRRATLMRAHSDTAHTTQLLGCYVHSAFDNAAASAAELKQQHGAALELGAGQSGALVRVQITGDVTKHLADMRALVRSLSTHIAGMKPRGISGSVPAAAMSAVPVDEEAEPLYVQSYLFDDALTVQQLLQQRAKAWGLQDISVVDFAYWQCGEGIERKSDNLRDEVAKLLN